LGGGSARPKRSAVAFHAVFPAAGPAGADGDRRTLVEAVADGWWYTALLPSWDRVAAFLTNADLADRRALLSAQGFVARLRQTRHVSAVLSRGAYRVGTRPRGADARSHRLDRFIGSGWVAVGDAATAFDPLSSQGILNALYTGLRAGQALDCVLSGEGGAALSEFTAGLEAVHAAYCGRGFQP
jgi:hypothetical protein